MKFIKPCYFCIMNESLLSYLYFGVCLFSVILLFDISINFKKPLFLKILFLLLLSCLFSQNLLLLFNWGTNIVGFIKTALLLIGLNILSGFYKHRLDKNFLFFSLGILCLLIFNMSIPIDTVHPKSEWQIVKKLIRTILTGSLLYISTIVYIKMNETLSEQNIYSKKIKKWTRITIAIFFVGITNNFLTVIFPSIMLTTRAISACINLVTCILLIYRPPFINRTELSFSLSQKFLKNSLNQINEEKFIHEFYTKQYYIKKETYVDEFAKIMNVSTPILNEYIQETTNMSFIDLINKKRIDHFVYLVSNKQFKEYSIEGLAELVGFGTRHSLYRYFKKYHGGSPSDLIRMYE